MRTLTTIDVLTGALVLITGWYAWLTLKMARASEASLQLTNQQLQNAARPYIEVTTFVPPGSIVFYLRIKNVGRSAAQKLRLTLDRDFFQYGDQSRASLREVAAFQQEIQSFPPGSELLFALAQGFVVFAPNADPAVVPSQFTVTASYSFDGPAVTEVHDIDLRPYLNTSISQPEELSELKKLREAGEDQARQLKTIANQVARIAKDSPPAPSA